MGVLWFFFLNENRNYSIKGRSYYAAYSEWGEMPFKYKQNSNNKNVYYLLLISYKEPKILDLKIYT